MSFKKYKSIGEVAQAFQLYLKEEEFLINIPIVKPSEALKEDLAYIMENYPYKVSEISIRETILFPIFKEVWRKYDKTLMLWSNKSINYKNELSGVPDYMVAKQSKLGKKVFETPLLAVVEAKKDDFEGGWAQCLYEMYAIQKLNGTIDLPVYGVVTNGDNWEFGKLEGNTFFVNKKPYSIFDLDRLMSAVHLFFEYCYQNALKIE